MVTDDETVVDQQVKLLLENALENCSEGDEIHQAYCFTYDIKATTMPTFEQARTDDGLLRKELAKMMSVFAMKIFNKSPDLSRVCSFSDIAGTATSEQRYIKLACQLWLMGLNQAGDPKPTFEPNEYVTRAQFGTVFARLIYNGKYNIPLTDTTVPRWKKHLDALKRDAIMTKVDDEAITMIEIRGYVMIMLRRFARNLFPKFDK